ncbi:MAG: hypothetical protein EON90_00125 [Brevundimonas sp.]|nr:MAG: hypothetical protein EON90_00125 [Brevundimonas sp.]
MLFATFSAGQSRACELVAEDPAAVQIDYNPFAIGQASGPLDILFVNQSDTACDLRLRLVDDGGAPLTGASVGGVNILFVPRESSGLLHRGAQYGLFELAIEPDDRVRAELDATVMNNMVAEAGEHATDLFLAVTDIDGQPLLPRIPIRMILRSTPRAQINIAGSAGAFGSGSTVDVIDFGEAATGATHRAFLQVRANTEATLTVRSEHHGVMRHMEGGETGSTVPYEVELDGIPVDLAEAWIHRVDPPRTLDGISLPLDFTLGAVAGQMSGKYEDLITIDVTPR